MSTQFFSRWLIAYKVSGFTERMRGRKKKRVKKRAERCLSCVKRVWIVRSICGD